MREPPDWSRYSDREIQEAIASNAFLAVGHLAEIKRILVWAFIMAAGVIGALWRKGVLG